MALAAVPEHQRTTWAQIVRGVIEESHPDLSEESLTNLALQEVLMMPTSAALMILIPACKPSVAAIQATARRAAFREADEKDQKLVLEQKREQLAREPEEHPTSPPPTPRMGKVVPAKVQPTESINEMNLRHLRARAREFLSEAGDVRVPLSQGGKRVTLREATRAEWEQRFEFLQGKIDADNQSLARERVGYRILTQTEYDSFADWVLKEDIDI